MSSSNPSPPLAGVGSGGEASSSMGPRRSPSSWAVIERSPQFVDAPGALPDAAEYAVGRNHPPGLSTLLIRRALLPGDVSEGHVDCTDTVGNILISVWSPSEQRHHGGGPRFLVCRAGTARLEFLPKVRPGVGVLMITPKACTGIVASDGAQFVVVQLQTAGAAGASSSSSSAPRSHLLALCFDSASPSRDWTSREVAVDQPRCFEALYDDEDSGMMMVEEVVHAAGNGEQNWPPVEFAAHMVLCHDNGRDLVFVDQQHGVMLLFDAKDPGAARMVQLPFTGDDEQELILMGPEDSVRAQGDSANATRRCAVCSQGMICALEFTERGWIHMWCLEEDQHDRWVPVFRVTSNEICWCDRSIGDRVKFGVVELGAVDPTNHTKLTFFAADAGIAFMVEVDRRASFSRSVRFLDKADARCASWLQPVIWKYDPADAVIAQGSAGAGAASTNTAAGGGWGTPKLSKSGKRLGRIAWSTARTCRKHLDKVMPFAQLAAAYSGPVGSKVVPVVAGLLNADKAAATLQEFGRWWSGRPAADVKVVGNLTEAARVVDEWKALEKPNNMVAMTAPGLSQDEVNELRDFFEDNGAKDFLPQPFQMVPRAINFD